MFAGVILPHVFLLQKLKTRNVRGVRIACPRDGSDESYLNTKLIIYNKLILLVALQKSSRLKNICKSKSTPHRLRKKYFPRIDSKTNILPVKNKNIKILISLTCAINYTVKLV